jgi:hypothetical protein
MKRSQGPRPERVWGPHRLLSMDFRGCFIGGQCPRTDMTHTAYMPLEIGSWTQSQLQHSSSSYTTTTTTTTSSCATTTLLGPWPPHYRGFKITLRHTTLGRTPLDEWSARRRNLYLTTHNAHKRRKCMPSVGFEPAIPVIEQLWAYAFWLHGHRNRLLQSSTCQNNLINI